MPYFLSLSNSNLHFTYLPLCHKQFIIAVSLMIRINVALSEGVWYRKFRKREHFPKFTLYSSYCVRAKVGHSSNIRMRTGKLSDSLGDIIFCVSAGYSLKSQKNDKQAWYLPSFIENTAWYTIMILFCLFWSCDGWKQKL